MKTYFSVGEISKLTNMSIQTLRYYDKRGLLKPSFIDSQNNYRYYSIEQFIKIDLLKQCKLMGLSLKEIEELLSSDISAESMMKIIDNQRKILDQKINALEGIREYINFLDNRLKEATKLEENEIFIKCNDERVVKRYRCIINDEKDLEINLRNVLLEAERNNWMLSSEIGFETSIDILKSEDRVAYTAIMIYRNDEKNEDIENTIIPKGNYLTMYYDDGYKNNLKYYKKMLVFIEINNLEVCGNFNEFSILPRINSKEEEKTIVQLDIPIKISR